MYKVAVVILMSLFAFGCAGTIQQETVPLSEVDERAYEEIFANTLALIEEWDYEKQRNGKEK